MAAFFGGDVAVAAMTTLHLDPSRRWLGWYNSPGTYEVARRYGKIAKSRLLEGLFPGFPNNLATLLGLTDVKGAKYVGARNGTVLEETGAFAALLMKDCEVRLKSQEVVVKGRTTQPMGITVAELNHVPQGQAVLQRTRLYAPIAAALPILVSFGTAAACAWIQDWICFSMIVLGILANGISCLIIGSGEFIFQYPVPHTNTGSGDGILVSEKDKEIVVLKGSESAVNSITRGSYSFTFDTNIRNRRPIKWCCLLLVFQLMVQLLLIPQGSLFGQIMFIASLTSSWLYNLWLSSWDRETTQRDVFVRGVLRAPRCTRYKLGTRTTAVVFTLLVLQAKDRKIMDMMIPNDTPGWMKLKANILSRIENEEEIRFDKSFWEDPEVADDKKVLELLCKDAESAYQGYLQHITL
ncbi:hypothetical protein ID866_7744, partial [Astraeus odoratus]